MIVRFVISIILIHVDFTSMDTDKGQLILSMGNDENFRIQ